MENNEVQENNSTVEKINMIDVEAERAIADFFEYTERLKTDVEFLNKCQKYQNIKNNNQ